MGEETQSAYIRRDLCIGKETYKRDLCIGKETFVLEKRPVYWKRDLHKRPIDCLA